ncbi:MAG: hypothetical protein EOP82_15555 [Variovorax sp.]|nr:MAG: hypothetical protein EOP82_15555 [Variovorax sp.]
MFWAPTRPREHGVPRVRWAWVARVRKTCCVPTKLGAALASLAGAMVGPIVSIQSGRGEPTLILTMVVIVIVIGGIGSIRDALFGGTHVGIVDTLGPRRAARFAIHAHLTRLLGRTHAPADGHHGTEIWSHGIGEVILYGEEMSASATGVVPPEATEERPGHAPQRARRAWPRQGSRALPAFVRQVARPASLRSPGRGMAAGR